MQIRYLIHGSWLEWCPHKGSMPHQGPWSQYVHCNNNMLANLKHNASALFWYTQRYHRSKGHGPWTTIGGYCAQPPRFRKHGTQASPPSSGCTVHAQGVKSWGVRFIGTEFCLAPPTAVADIFGPSTNDCFADKVNFRCIYPNARFWSFAFGRGSTEFNLLRKMSPANSRSRTRVGANYHLT